MIGLSVMILWIGVAPVGFGLAAWIQPFDAQLPQATMALALANVIDLAAERERLSKEIGKLQKEIDKIDERFANEQFMAKAPEEVVEENRERRAEAEAAAKKLKAALERLQAVAA